MGKQALLHPQHEDDRELEALDHVQRDQRHPLGAIVHGVHVAHQRDILQEGLKPFSGWQPVVLRGQATELEHIAPAFLPFRTAFLDVALVRAAQQQQVDHLDEPALLAGGAHLVDEVAEIRQRAPGGGAQVRHLFQAVERVPGGHPVGVRPVAELGEGFFAEFPPRHVDHP